MKRRSIVLFLCIAVFLGGCDLFFKNSHPPYKGRFLWEKIVIDKDLSGLTNGVVFDSLVNMKEAFRLEFGDECYYLQGEQWVWRDPKDMMPFVPIFCLKKGGGWAIQSG
jgi:hypothetical protein